jgi:hypothetical protein
MGKKYTKLEKSFWTRMGGILVISLLLCVSLSLGVSF